MLFWLFRGRRDAPIAARDKGGINHRRNRRVGVEIGTTQSGNHTSFIALRNCAALDPATAGPSFPPLRKSFAAPWLQRLPHIVKRYFLERHVRYAEA